MHRRRPTSLARSVIRISSCYTLVFASTVALVILRENSSPAIRLSVFHRTPPSTVFHEKNRKNRTGRTERRREDIQKWVETGMCAFSAPLLSLPGPYNNSRRTWRRLRRLHPSDATHRAGCIAPSEEVRNSPSSALKSLLVYDNHIEFPVEVQEKETTI